MNSEHTTDKGYFSKVKKNTELQKKQNLFEINCQLSEEKFQSLDRTSCYSDRVEPTYYTILLLLGLVTSCFSIIFIIHIFRYMSLNVDDKTLGPFLNKMLYNIDQSMFSYFSTVLLIIMGFYCLASAAMGHAKFGLRFFWFKFYPLVPKQTFSNAFFANCLMFNYYSCATTMWLCTAFSGYIAGTSAAKIWNV